MGLLLRAIDRLLCAIIANTIHVVKLLIDLILWLDELRRLLPRTVRRWTGSLRRLAKRLFVGEPPVPPHGFRHRRRPWNRTPEHVEQQLARLHVEHPFLGSGGLRSLARRVIAFKASRETVRRILLRRRDLIVALEEQRRRKPRRIKVGSARLLWGLDLTLVWLLGFIPVWILGVVDYHGSRLMALQRLRWPSTATLTLALDEAFRRHGTPMRILTDNAPIFRSEAFEMFLEGHKVRHSHIRPAHAWTNGRIERLFRTFKETVFRYTWVFTSLRHILLTARSPPSKIWTPSRLGQDGQPWCGQLGEHSTRGSWQLALWQRLARFSKSSSTRQDDPNSPHRSCEAGGKRKGGAQQYQPEGRHRELVLTREEALIRSYQNNEIPLRCPFEFVPRKGPQPRFHVIVPNVIVPPDEHMQRTRYGAPPSKHPNAKQYRTDVLLQDIRNGSHQEPLRHQCCYESLTGSTLLLIAFLRSFMVCPHAFSTASLSSSVGGLLGSRSLFASFCCALLHSGPLSEDWFMALFIS
jgi:transposase InsO family protein